MGSLGYWVKFMVFNAIFNNISVISWRSILLVEEENHRSVFCLETDTAIKLQGNTNRHSVARIIVITIQQKDRCRLNALKQFCIQRFNDNDTDGDRAIP
jgi:hypothetical protein